MWTLANTFSARLPVYLGQHQLLRGTPWYEVYAAHVVRHVQINVYEYLQELQVAGGEIPKAPTFQELHRGMQRGSFHMSAEWLPLPASVTLEPQLVTVSPLGVASVNTRSTRASAASTGSGLTATTTIGRTGGTAAGASNAQGSYVPNPARDTEFDALQLRPQMRELLRANPPPRNDANNEFCVSWWGRGAVTAIAVERRRTGRSPAQLNAGGCSPMCKLTSYNPTQLPHRRRREATDEEARGRRLLELLHPGSLTPRPGGRAMNPSSEHRNVHA